MTDANSAMAFFYPSLNSWVLSARHFPIWTKMGTSTDTCQKDLCHVEFRLTFQTDTLWTDLL
jgi:hypothetical protein